ncbi:catenin delta-1-like protein [Sarcoptes scabiei]|nr:catenin delta-1-like protein [Sarcoptes scabiei]
MPIRSSKINENVGDLNQLSVNLVQSNENSRKEFKIDSSTNDYTNFPGPKAVDSENSANHSDSLNLASSEFQANSNYENFDSHYSNANFQKIYQKKLQTLQHSLIPNSSPGPSPSVITGSTTSYSNAINPHLYDPYARNNQIGYTNYSNFSNYQDVTSVNEKNSPINQRQTAASPKPAIQRHHLSDVNSTSEGTYGQNPIVPVYGYVPTSLQMPMNNNPNIHPPSITSTGIYGNFQEATPPQGYLDRRPTYDENNGSSSTIAYGEMIAPTSRNIPITPAMYEDAESAYHHLQAFQQPGLIDSDSNNIFFQNKNLHVHGDHPLVAGAPGSSAVTAIGPDGVRWRDPDLHEVIEFLSLSNNVVRANAAAYLQHLCFMDDSMKAKTRALGGIPALMNLLSQDVPEIQKNACGALRNLSYGRQNDENKIAIRNAGGIPALVRLLRKSPDNEIRELITSILWNLSSCEHLKRQIIDDSLQALVSVVIIPNSGWEKNNSQQSQSQIQQPIYWSTVFRNASGVLRNVSSAGEYARRLLRECDGLVDSLLFLVRAAIGKNDMDNKSVENCVCILRNLSYRCQEVVDPEYDKNPPGSSSSNSQSNSNSSSLFASSASPSSTLSPSSSSSSKNSSSSLMGGISSKVGENISCFGGSKKKSKNQNNLNHSQALSPSVSASGLDSKTANLSINERNGGLAKGMELLWQTDVVQPYLALLSECSNPETLEAAAGAIQNLAACYWQPSIDIRGAVRKEKGLPILVELLRMEVDRVVCAVATALRNLAMDTRNKELIGKYALKDLVSKLPAPSATGVPLETGTSDDTIAAVLATLNEVISKNPDFAKSMLEAGGMQRLNLIIKNRNRFCNRVVKFTSQLLHNMWQHVELRDVYRKAGWKETHFIISNASNSNVRMAPTRSINNSSGNMTLMTPSQSALMLPSTPTVNGTISATGFYHPINANNTLSRPMSTVGGTKFEDHGQYRGASAMSNTMPNSDQMHNQIINPRLQEEMLMSDMIDGCRTETAIGQNSPIVRPPVGGVPIFPPGTLPGEPVYAQVNRERKRQQQQQISNSTTTSVSSPIVPLDPAINSNVKVDSINREVIYAASMPAGDSWV